MAEDGTRQSRESAPSNAKTAPIIVLESDEEDELDSKELFLGFILKVRHFIGKDEVMLLREKFATARDDFVCSRDFKSSLQRRCAGINNSNVYIHFNEILQQIRANQADVNVNEEDKPCTSGNRLNEPPERKRSIIPQKNTFARDFGNCKQDTGSRSTIKHVTSVPGTSKEADRDCEIIILDDDSTPSSLKSKESHTEKNGEGKEGKPQNTSESKEERRKRHAKKLKAIAKLEKKLEMYDEEIKRLDLVELSLEEMEHGHSSYIKKSKLEEKCNEIWNKICFLQRRPTNTGRVVEREVKCKSTGVPQIDRAVKRFLKNRTTFPDIFDIRNLVSNAVKKHKLKFSASVQDELANEIFTDIGNKMQKKRKKDFAYNFGCHLTDSCKPSKDPALDDHILLQKLEDNKRRGESALNEVFRKYVHLGRMHGIEGYNGAPSTSSGLLSDDSDGEPLNEQNQERKKRRRESGDTDDSVKARKKEKKRREEQRDKESSLDFESSQELSEESFVHIEENSVDIDFDSAEDVSCSISETEPLDIDQSQLQACLEKSQQERRGSDNITYACSISAEGDNSRGNKEERNKGSTPVLENSQEVSSCEVEKLLIDLDSVEDATSKPQASLQETFIDQPAFGISNKDVVPDNDVTSEHNSSDKKYFLKIPQLNKDQGKLMGKISELVKKQGLARKSVDRSQVNGCQASGSKVCEDSFTSDNQGRFSNDFENTVPSLSMNQGLTGDNQDSSILHDNGFSKDFDNTVIKVPSLKKNRGKLDRKIAELLKKQGLAKAAEPSVSKVDGLKNLNISQHDNSELGHSSPNYVCPSLGQSREESFQGQRTANGNNINPVEVHRITSGQSSPFVEASRCDQSQHNSSHGNSPGKVQVNTSGQSSPFVEASRGDQSQHNSSHGNSPGKAQVNTSGQSSPFVEASRGDQSQHNSSHGNSPAKVQLNTSGQRLLAVNTFTDDQSQYYSSHGSSPGMYCSPLELFRNKKQCNGQINQKPGIDTNGNGLANVGMNSPQQSPKSTSKLKSVSKLNGVPNGHSPKQKSVNAIIVLSDDDD
ncbi:uncharacterized protein LOC116619823 isoform X2 [Nematostella vectensis]|uniref:uncharacterized protein LOC116619823 isoform X3 n=1 Tax=Nematostella vectensis TaxID=45351 RepID=UPI001390524F|nr:uncharacterized protein LOC116619823 isoform X3 [Nematostella vectensis]XP_048587744.1 uncharacterized protein LOC116619823 isoform X2 [Nematostella vectensis]